MSMLMLMLMLMLMPMKLETGFKANRSTMSLHSGPQKLRFIGCMHLFIGSPPHHAPRDLARKHGPLMPHGTCNSVKFLLLLTPTRTAKEVMQTLNTDFQSRPRVLAA
ncbi:Cytochrome [Abeliophyllum distichum]|uniref:Cytochrome n=1 Tax=Abeliophyllum distichum TaxID=126358 RepID=A0ABD1UFH0_9LAMI